MLRSTGRYSSTASQAAAWRCRRGQEAAPPFDASLQPRTSHRRPPLFPLVPAPPCMNLPWTTSGAAVAEPNNCGGGRQAALGTQDRRLSHRRSTGCPRSWLPQQRRLSAGEENRPFNCPARFACAALMCETRAHHWDCGMGWEDGKLAAVSRPPIQAPAHTPFSDNPL